MSTLNNVVLFVLVLFVLSVGSFGCTVDTDGGGGSPTGPTTTTPTTPVDNPGAEPYWYDDTLYHQLVYNAYDAPVYDTSFVMENPSTYDIVFSRSDPGGLCTITSDTITMKNGDRHTLRELFNESLGLFDSPFWFIYDHPPLWTGRFYIEDNAPLRRGRFVVRFVSDFGTTARGRASVGAADPEIKIFYDYNCALRNRDLLNAARTLQHEFGHALGFFHPSFLDYPDTLMHGGGGICELRTSGRRHCVSPTLDEQHHMVWAYERGRNARRATGWPGGIPVGFSGLQRPAYPVRLPRIVIDD